MTENNERLYDESSRETQDQQESTPIMVKAKAKEPEGNKNRERLSDESMNRYPQPEKGRNQQSDTETKRHVDESRESQSADSWDTIHEVIESDFLISPGDIYPSRKVELQDTEVSEEMLHKFELLCEDQHEAFSRNNEDIGKTQLIEMEIDTGNSVPLAQSPYTLPLKHYDWVRKEIEKLEKAGVIERSLSPWASPMIVVAKKSAPDEPPRRCLCVDYRRSTLYNKKSNERIRARAV